MGMLFEPAFGSFPGMDSYETKACISFGSQVDFEARFILADLWNSEERHKHETPLSSETPELSSLSSSPYSSRPSSFLSESQGSSYSSLPDPEPYVFGVDPGFIVEHVGAQGQIMQTSYYGGEASPFPIDYSFVEPTSHNCDNMFAPEPSHLSPTPFSLRSSKPLPHAKVGKSTYSTSSGQLSTYGYLYPATMIPPCASTRPDLSPDDSISSVGHSERSRGRCPDCRKVFKDLKAHMLTHMKERPEKCPIVTCEYHIKGFRRKYDKNRHTLTHYGGTMVCCFCPVSAAKTFNRADVFKRHLLSVHGVEHTPPPTSRKNPSSKTKTHWVKFPGGTCSICSLHFSNPQDFYNHLDDCVISSVLQSASIPPGRTEQGISVENATPVKKRTQQPGSSSPVEKILEIGWEDSTNYYPAPCFDGDFKFYMHGTDPNPSSGHLLQASHPPGTRLKRTASSISRISDLGTAEEGEKRYKATRCRLSAAAANQFSSSVTGNDLFGTLMKDDTKLFDEVEVRMPLIELSDHIKDLDIEQLRQKDDFLLKKWWKEQNELVAPGESNVKNISRLCPDVLRPSTSRESPELKCVSVWSNEDREGCLKSYLSAGTKHHFEAPAELAPLLPPDMTANQDTTRKHEPLIHTTEQKSKNPSPARKASLLPLAGTAIQDAAPKQDIPEQYIKKEIDLTLSNFPETKPSTPETVCNTVASSPETDISEDISDDESVSDCSTDWGDDQITSSPGSDLYRILEEFHSDYAEGEKNLLRPILSPMKQGLVDRIMAEFWTIVNQEWAANLTKCVGETPTSSSPSCTNGNLITGSSPQSANRKRQRDDGEDPPPEDNNGRTPKRPNSQPERSPPKNSVKFACPYRKHSPHTYTIYKHRSCALSHWDTVARVKEHLYRRHRVPIQCKRCWQTFKTDAALDDHITVVNICALQTGQAAEGLTSDQVKRLKSRKKSSPDQSEEERWKEIYRILFPNEHVPNPYFEPVQENAPQSPDSRELADYEEYSRQELPRFFRSYLEDAVNNQTQHLEENLRSELVSIVKDCQDRMFSAYKSRVASKDNIPTPDSTSIETCVTPTSQVSPEETADTSKRESKDIIASVYAPTPESTLQYVPDLRELGTQLKGGAKCIQENSFSDSAYSSCPSGSQPPTASFQTQEPTIAKLSNESCGQFPFGDGGSGGDALPDLSFDDSFYITSDMIGSDFGLFNLGTED